MCLSLLVTVCPSTCSSCISSTVCTACKYKNYLDTADNMCKGKTYVTVIFPLKYIITMTLVNVFDIPIKLEMVHNLLLVGFFVLIVVVSSNCSTNLIGGGHPLF